jgi:hypothetical protein
MWDKVGMARNAQVEQANEIAACEEFYKDVKVPGTDKVQSKKATRVADFLELENCLLKMLHRNESWRSLQRRISN